MSKVSLGSPIIKLISSIETGLDQEAENITKKEEPKEAEGVNYNLFSLIQDNEALKRS